MAQNRAYDEEAPVEEVVADLLPEQGGARDIGLSAQQEQAVRAANFFVLPADALNEIVGYLMERPWRETNHLLRAIDGVRSLDEYVG